MKRSDSLRNQQRHYNIDFFMIPRDFVACSLSGSVLIIGQGALLSQK